MLKQPTDENDNILPEFPRKKRQAIDCRGRIIMFKFDFKVDTEDIDNPFGTVTKTKAKNSEQVIKGIDWYDSEEIRADAETLDHLDVYKLNSTELIAGDVTLQYVVAGFLLSEIAAGKEGITNLGISRAEENQTDLIPGVYEGGAKIWECTTDLLQYLSENCTNAGIQGKRVLDLGCGSGLLGIFAYKCGAKVHFQDYNKDVLQSITIPNLLLNVPKPPLESDLNLSKLHEEVRFRSGDWSKYAEATRNDEPFDLILTSETIYNTDNQQKLLDTFHAKLKPTGVVLVAAKTYYFGVGGGLRQFEELILNDNRFHSEVLWTATEGISREILKLSFL